MTVSRRKAKTGNVSGALRNKETLHRSVKFFQRLAATTIDLVDE